MCALRSLTWRPQVAIGQRPLFESSEDSEPWLRGECAEDIDCLREPLKAGYGWYECVLMKGDAEPETLPIVWCGL